MSRFVFKLPDLGEGTVSAEVVAWRARPGEAVAEDQPLLELSTDKAVVEIPSPVSGRLLSVAAAAGQSVAVGAELAVFEVGETEATPQGPLPTTNVVPVVAGEQAPSAAHPLQQPEQAAGTRVRASPATRRRAREAGVDLTRIAGSGPGGRIEAADLERAIADRAGEAPYEEIPVVGVRRLIAERMSEAKRRIPHFSYVEEVDVTELEALRRRVNAALPDGQTPMSLLPLIAAGLVRVLRDFPQCNAHYDESRNVIRRFRSVHLGIATQTADGLKVPVLRDADKLDLAGLAAGIRRVAEAARSRTAGRELFAGSTITVTSLGKLGGIASTPILNAPEVAIVGVNRAGERVVVHDGKMTIRRMMNLSSSFDHRFVDGYDAAQMIQALKGCLEHPATIFL